MRNADKKIRWKKMNLSEIDRDAGKDFRCGKCRKITLHKNGWDANRMHVCSICDKCHKKPSVRNGKYKDKNVNPTNREVSNILRVCIKNGTLILVEDKYKTPKKYSKHFKLRSFTKEEAFIAASCIRDEPDAFSHYFIFEGPKEWAGCLDTLFSLQGRIPAGKKGPIRMAQLGFDLYNYKV